MGIAINSDNNWAVNQGEMLYIPETDMMLFLCSPSVMNLDDLTK